MRTVWIEAMRPRTLPLATASIVMGSFLTAADDTLEWPVALLSLLTALLLQVLSNLANDYGDSVHGADHSDRAGPSRAVQSGRISSQMMKRMMGLFAILSVASGITTLWLAFGAEALPLFLLFILLGAAAIIAAVTYTAGSKPYGYVGLGDIFVLIFFGWVGVLGSYFLQAHALEWRLLLPATSTGLLTVAVLNVNNIRDIDSDKLAGKRSIPVRLGHHRARLYHWGLLSVSLGAALLYVLLHFTGYGQLLFLILLPLFWKNGITVYRTESAKLDPMLKQTSLLTLLFVFSFGLGQLL